MDERHRRIGKRGLWIAAALLIAGLAFHGDHIADLLPKMETWVQSLGPRGPAFFFLAVLLLEPVFFPNTLFGMTAGFVFGLWKGYLIYFGSVYVANLIVYLIGRRLLQRPVMSALDRRPKIKGAVSAAETQGTSLVFWIRLLPLNPAVFSYAFGAVHVPFRAIALGTLGMFPHMFFDVYLGTVAAHVTTMSADHHTNWEAKGVGLVLGLIAVAALSFRLTRIARAQIQAAGVVDAP
ncbi:MAG: VTT domain-containing protein [Polyangiales bacterium]